MPSSVAARNTRIAISERLAASRRRMRRGVAAIILARQEREYRRVEFGRVLQYGEVADARQDQELRVRHLLRQLLGMVAPDRLVMVAVRYHHRRPDPAEVGRGPVRLR